MASEGSTIAKFAVPGILGLLAALGLILFGRSLDSSRDTDRENRDAIQRIEMKVAAVVTDVAVIKAVVVDTQLASRVATLESEVKTMKEKLPK